MKDEDEDPLEGVEGGEEIGHDHRLLVDEEEAKSPGEAQQEEQRNGPQGPGSGSGRGDRHVRVPASRDTSPPALMHLPPGGGRWKDPPGVTAWGHGGMAFPVTLSPSWGLRGRQRSGFGAL